MIKKVNRLSDLPVLYKLITEGKTIVVYNKSNFKINLSQIKGRKIIGINQLGDENDRLNSIRIDYDTNESKYLYFYNGTQGDTGEKGNKGPQGDKGESFNKDQVLSRASDVLVIANDDITNDREKVWSAYRGKVLKEFLDSISQITMTDEEYQLRFNEQIFVDLQFETKRNNQDSYIVYNDDANHRTYVKYWTYEDEADERYYYIDSATNDYVEAPNNFDIWRDYYLANSDKTYYTRKLHTTIINEDTGESTSEWVYTKVNVPVWLDLEFVSYNEDQKSLLIYSDKELGDDGVINKDPQEEEIVISHKPITSIVVDNPNFTLPINSIITKPINILPVDYLNSPICIEYDDDMINVYEDGRIMALGNSGSTSIKIYSQENPAILATININIVIPVIDILFDTMTIKAFKGYVQQINATVLPSDATNPEINWYSSNDEIAEVDETGKITLKSEGKVTIYAESTDGSNIVSRIDVTVDTAVEQINFKNTDKAIVGQVGLVLDFNRINELLGETIVTNDSQISASNINLTINNRTKKITFANQGASELSIINGTEITNINVVIDISTEDFVVKEHSYEILVGHSTKVEAEVLPENASNKGLNWVPVVNNSNISIGNEPNGVDARIFLSDIGTYDIVVTPKDGSNIENHITIIGVTPITSIELNKTSISLDLGETFQLVATINNNANNKNIIWTSSNPNVASVDETGFVRTLVGGDTTITATAADGSGVFATCNVSSVVLITSITINNGNDINIYAGNEYNITANILPINAYNKKLIWYTSDETIATINNGMLHALKEGTIKVYAMADDNSGIITSINANISIPTNELLLSDTQLNLQVNETYSLIATVIPDNTTNQNVTFESIDPTIASIDNDGNIVALKAGETEIFVKTIDGTNLSKICTINITD